MCCSTIHIVKRQSKDCKRKEISVVSDNEETSSAVGNRGAGKKLHRKLIGLDSSCSDGDMRNKNCALMMSQGAVGTFVSNAKVF